VIPFYLERIRRGVDFVEAHLDDDVRLSAVAGAAGLSQWHFQRMFKSMTGETLKGYIRARRLSVALDRLLDTDCRIIDLAVRAGFDSQEAFARAFRKAFGMSPSAYRKLGKRLFLRKLELDEAMIRHTLGNVSLEPELRQRPATTFIGCRTQFYGADSEKNNMGEKLPPLWAAFLPRRFEIEHARTDVCYGVLRQEREDDDHLDYFAACEVRAGVAMPTGMETVEIPAATYACFEHRGAAQTVDRTVSYAYSTWLMRSGRMHTYGPDLEIYDHRYHPTDERSVFVYALPIVD